MRKWLVIWLLVSILVTTAGCSLFSPKEEPLTGELPDLASAFVADLAHERFDQAVTYFDTAMGKAISESQLQEIWGQLQGQLGPFEAEVEQRQETQDAYQVIYVTVRFEKSYLDVKLVFKTNKRIAGLFFAQSDYLSRYYEPPDYADPSLFTEETVTVGSGTWALSGTLSIPVGTGPFPVVVLVHGSGPHDRDETIGPNKPFKDLAWGLASRQVAVLRYEKRTKAHGDKMGLLANVITPKIETVDDAVLAVDLLKTDSRIDPTRIIVIGHSLGGMLAPRIATEGTGIAGLVSMAGTPRGLEDLVLEQVKYLSGLDGTVTVDEQAQIDALAAQVLKVKTGLSSGTPATELPLGIPTAYWQYLQAYDAGQEARNAGLPMLILQGERDYQVTMTDFNAWASELAPLSRVTYRSFPELNHLFMAGSGAPNPDEYMEPANMSLQVIESIADWIGTL
jgi:hypothetical protein